MKKRKVVIDADGLIFLVASGYTKIEDRTGAKPIKGLDVDITSNKLHFKTLVKDLFAQVEILSVGESWKPKKPKLIYSDSTNFRYDIFPTYKAKRSEKTPITKMMTAWCKGRKKAIIVPGTEADDVIAHEVRNGAIGMTSDKDLLYGVPGTWFDIKHNTWIETTPEDAERFTLLQTLAGDSTDGIPGIPRVGMKTAENILVSQGANWEGVVKAYKAAGLTLEDAILNRRLVGMDQFNGKEIELWQPNK